jgi:two-component system alkaline phosphatase synthesis response regulator PhoP
LTKILIADHDRDYRELVVFSLRFAGYTMLVASNGDECIEMANQHQPELILIELDLIDINGVELCRKLREDEKTAAIPVIFLVNADNVDQLVNQPGGRSQPCWLKTLSPDQLTRKINEFLQHNPKP